MTTQWKYKQGDSEFGPVTSRQLKELAVAGRLVPDDLVWNEGLADWVSARRVNGLFETNSTDAAAALSGVDLGARVEKLNLGAKAESAEPTLQGQTGKAPKQVVGDRKHQASQDPNGTKTRAPPPLPPQYDTSLGNSPTFPVVADSGATSPQHEPQQVTPSHLAAVPHDDPQTNCPYCTESLNCEGLVGEFACPKCNGCICIEQPGSHPIPAATLPPMTPPSKPAPEPPRDENPYQATEIDSSHSSDTPLDLRRERPIGVVLTGVYAAVGCLQSLFSHYFMMILTVIASSVVAATDEGIGVVIGMQIVSVFYFIFAIVNATICYGLFTLQRWAQRITIIGYSVMASLRMLSLFILIPVAAAQDSGEDIPVHLLMSLPSLVFEVIILIYFFQPTVKNYFQPQANRG